MQNERPPCDGGDRRGPPPLQEVIPQRWLASCEGLSMRARERGVSPGQPADRARPVSRERCQSDLRRRQPAPREAALQHRPRKTLWKRVQGSQRYRRSERPTKQITLLDPKVIEDGSHVIDKVGVCVAPQPGSISTAGGQI